MFPGFPVMQNNMDKNFSSRLVPSVTDFGICTTLNGETWVNTYSSNDRLSPLRDILDPRNDSMKPLKVQGSGKLYQMEFWLNMRSGTTQGVGQSEISVAINNWLDFFNVRASRFTVMPGMSLVVKLNPTVHLVSEPFMEISLDKRGCRFHDEQPDPENSMFKFYSKKACMFECSLRAVVEKVD